MMSVLKLRACQLGLRRTFHSVMVASTLITLAGCATAGDFGRPRPSPFSDDAYGVPPSPIFGERAELFMLTDDERLLRNLAYPLIAPPYDRGLWDAHVSDFGQTRVFKADWTNRGMMAYAADLTSTQYRSATARYARLIEDVNNDVVRLEPFFSTAWRVADMDRKRQKSLRYVSGLDAAELANVKARVGENMMIIGWVHRSLRERVSAYRYALERLVIATPSPRAVEAERALKDLEARIRSIRVAVTPNALPDVGDPSAARGIVSKD